ncbi:MAG: FliH/SctL family protein [Pirellula sp.]|nr:FliH/SctL family protein [Pirellula sp.]
MAVVFKSRAVVPGANTVQAEVFNWDDVTERAKEYLDTVRQQAQHLLKESQAECDRIRNLAQQEGLKSSQSQIQSMAQQKAQEIAAETLRQTSESVQRFCSELESATSQWLRQWQHETITLAIAIAEKILVRQMESDPTILLDWIQDSVRMVSGQRNLTLRLHPDDAARLSEPLTQIMESSGPGVQLQVAEDVAVGRFGVILQTEDTTIDRTMKTQLRRLMEELQ